MDLEYLLTCVKFCLRIHAISTPVSTVHTLAHVHLEEGLPVLVDGTPAVVHNLSGLLFWALALWFHLCLCRGRHQCRHCGALPIFAVGCLCGALGRVGHFENHDVYCGLMIHDPQYLLLEFFRLSIRTESLKLVMLLILARRALRFVTIDTRCPVYNREEAGGEIVTRLG